VIVYEFLTDTIYEYITIDCETGLECIDDPGLTCPDWTSVYLPNTFTPNGDGLNDTWKMVYDLDCWVDVEFKIFNRWGDMIYSGMGDYFDSYPYWDGSVNGGDHYASDGVYTYTFYAKKFGSTEVFQRHGHITIFR
jgi:gliding motility-associated-like protein